MLNVLILVFVVIVNSSPSKDPVEDAMCTYKQKVEVQNKLQACTFSTASSVHMTIKDLSSDKTIADELCKSLTTIMNVCVEHLKKCFPRDIFKLKRKTHLEEVKTFFLQIGQDIVSNNSFENCRMMENGEKVMDDYDLLSESKGSKVLVEIFIDLAIKASPVMFAMIFI